MRFLKSENIMPIPATIEQPVREKFQISLGPAQNAIASMMLITKNEDMPGVNPWIINTRASLTEDEFFRHKLVIIGFYYVILPKVSQASFPNYLDTLDTTDPSAMVDKLLTAYTSICSSNKISFSTYICYIIYFFYSNKISFLLDFLYKKTI